MKCLLVVLAVLAGLSMVSCDDGYPYVLQPCGCHDDGNSIDGWDEHKDTTITEKKDTISGGFFIEVSEWGDTVSKKVPI